LGGRLPWCRTDDRSNTSRYTHLTSHTAEQCGERINALMNHFNLGWGTVL
jgi:hypothetical protein